MFTLKFENTNRTFYPELWDEVSSESLYNFPFMNEPYESAMSDIRNPQNVFAKVPIPIQDPSQLLYADPPAPQHKLSEDDHYLFDSDKPIISFTAIFRKYEFMTILDESKRYRKQKHFDQAIISLLHVKKLGASSGCRCGLPMFHFQIVGQILWTRNNYLRSRKTGMVGTSSLTSLPPDLEYPVNNMHPLIWAYKLSNCEANIKYKSKGIGENLKSNELLALVVWMGKKSRTRDKRVVFITKCVPSAPTSPSQYQEKNIKDPSNKYSRNLIPVHLS